MKTIPPQFLVYPPIESQDESGVAYHSRLGNGHGNGRNGYRHGNGYGSGSNYSLRFADCEGDGTGCGMGWCLDKLMGNGKG